MIVVTIELHSAVTGGKQLLGRAIIANDGTALSGKVGNYDVAVARKPDADNLAKTWAQPLRKARVENYPRLSYNVWRLIVRALLAAFPEERGS